MTRGTYEFFLAIACAVSIWTLFVIMLPGASRARFGQKLTELRDEIEDKFLLEGPYVQDKQIQMFHTNVEGLLEHAYGFTMSNVLVINRALRRANLMPEPTEWDWSGYPTEVQAAFETYKVRLVRACARYLVFGTITGWVVGAVAFSKMFLSRPKPVIAEIRPIFENHRIPDAALAKHPVTQQAMTDYELALDIDPGLLNRHLSRRHAHELVSAS